MTPGTRKIPLPITVPTTTAVACATVRSRTRLGAWLTGARVADSGTGLLHVHLLGEEEAGRVSDHESCYDTDGNIPGERNPGCARQIKRKRETARHADHGALCVGATSE